MQTSTGSTPLQSFRSSAWRGTLDRRLRAGVAVIAACLSLPFAAPTDAQDANNGKTLYNTVLVAGERSCGNGACHGPDPRNRQNRIQLGEDPGNIAQATQTVVQMNFLRGRLSTAQLIDLAAYIANPAAATGAPVAQLSTASLSFGSVTVGSTAPAQAVTLSNTGSSPLTVSAITSGNSEFAVNGSCGVIAVSGSCTVTIRFTPGATGPRSGSVTFLHNAAGGASTVAVTGDGVAAVGSLRVQPTTVIFAPTRVGVLAAEQTVEVANTGTAALSLQGLALQPDAAAFQITGSNCATGLVLEAGALCRVALRFAPTAAVSYAAQLVVTPGSGAAVAVALVGQGIADPTQTRSMVEYRYAPLDYYFITSSDSEKATLDNFAGWARTGLSFPVLVAEATDRVGISRYYFDRIAKGGARGSHFYTLVAAEKAALAALNPDNLAAPRLPYNEGIDAWAFAPVQDGVGGSCAAGLAPVLRLFRGNARFPDDPNHRFTTSQAVYDEFVARGWDGEGVKFCVPAP